MIHRKLRILEDLLSAARLTGVERDPDRGGEKQLSVVECDGRAQPLAQRLGEGDDALGLAFRQEDNRELIACQPSERVLRFDQSAKPPCQR